MLYHNNSQATSGDFSQFIDDFCADISAQNFRDAESKVLVLKLDLSIANRQTDEQWRLLEVACGKILDTGKAKPNATGWATADFRSILYKFTNDGQPKTGVHLSESTGVRLQVSTPENTGCSQNIPDKKSNNTNNENGQKSLISSVPQPDYDNVSYLHKYTPSHTPTDHTNNHTTNTKKSKTSKGKIGARKLVPHGTGSIIDLASVRTKCAIDRTGYFDRSAPAGISRPEQYQKHVDNLADPFLTPRYRDLTEEQKFAQGCILAANNNGLFFRISFSDKLAVMFRNPACNAASFVTDKLNRALKLRFGQNVAFAFKFEHSRDKKSVKPMHLHGVMLIAHDSMTDEQTTELKRLMCNVGGVSLKNDGAHIRDIYDGLGVYGYLKKAENRTKLYIASGDLTGANQLMVKFQTKMHAENRYYGRSNDNSKLMIAA
ncbi:hypothetical protein K1X45_14695 [Pseudochrobactrum sp. Wa41.01b-1]|uniref:hypothetical protein n=1 Tax=Pseudochrobactrum sp. Wa41.01b-1 TaxID=2864102 RepID=UPI001C68D911|nr:hypothetical protein [Pseudochrobactrum sp. Wa41.01b-1]QYM72679.1 hypothetical protein K1X45_14695 [Pseudochrobactrum sp. Wa41.01b-1]